jgi:hypothetical protein
MLAVTHGNLGHGLQVAALQVWCDNTGGTADGELAEGIMVFDSPGGQAHLLGTLTPQHMTTMVHIPYIIVSHIETTGHIAVTVFGLLAYGTGALIRHTAGAITSILGVIFLIPALAQALPNTWFWDVDRWLPGGEALSPIARSAPPISDHLFSAWGEFAMFSGYAVVLLALGAWSFIRRDA